MCLSGPWRLLKMEQAKATKSVSLINFSNRRSPFKVFPKLITKILVFRWCKFAPKLGAYLDLGAFKKFFQQDWAIIRTGRLIENLL